MPYLLSNIVAEPLVGQWYAWAHLLSPLTAGLNIVNRHLRIMQSFVAAPDLHAKACRNEKLEGGPFVDLGEAAVPLIKELIERTRVACVDLIDLAAEFKALDANLHACAKGGSLEHLQRGALSALRGSVELVYDLNDHPSCRLIEPMLHQRFDMRPHQSIALSVEGDRCRPFVLSTPRLEAADRVHVASPFENSGWDRLFAMRRHPDEPSELLDELEIRSADHQLFLSFFGESPPPHDSARNYDGDGVRLRHFGHACVAIETKQVTILTDPVFHYGGSKSDSGFDIDDLPDRIDYVLVTHTHLDHFFLEALLQLRHRIGVVVVPSGGNGALADPSPQLMLRKLGFRSVRRLAEMEEIAIDGGTITGIPFFGEHADLNIGSKLAYSVEVEGHRFAFLADAHAADPEAYAAIRDVIGAVDTAFLGLACSGAPMSWLYGALRTFSIDRSRDTDRTMSGSNAESGLALVKALGCREAIVYAMGWEEWLHHVIAQNPIDAALERAAAERFVALCIASGVESELPTVRWERRYPRAK